MEPAEERSACHPSCSNTHHFESIAKGDKLVIAGLEHDWLKDLVSKNGLAIAHEKVEGSIVLTASTEALQEFVKKYAAEPKAFASGDLLQDSEFH